MAIRNGDSCPSRSSHPTLSDAQVSSATLCDDALVSNDEADAETCRTGIAETTAALREGRDALRGWLGGDFQPGADQEDPERGDAATPTREPTATPDSTAETADVRELMTAFYNQTGDSGDQLQSLSDLTDGIVDDPTLLFDADTQSDLSDILDDIRDTHDDALALDPSNRQQDIYDLWTEITGDLSDAADEDEVGFLAFDADAIERGTALVNRTDGPLDDLAVAVDTCLEDTGRA